MKYKTMWKHLALHCTPAAAHDGLTSQETSRVCISGSESEGQVCTMSEEKNLSACRVVSPKRHQTWTLIFFLSSVKSVTSARLMRQTNTIWRENLFAILTMTKQDKSNVRPDVINSGESQGYLFWFEIVHLGRAWKVSAFLVGLHYWPWCSQQQKSRGHVCGENFCRRRSSFMTR